MALRGRVRGRGVDNSTGNGDGRSMGSEAARDSVVTRV